MSSNSKKEGGLHFNFPDTWLVLKYDQDEQTMFYQKFKKLFNGIKAVDFIAFDPQEKTVYFIEVKDFRQHCRSQALALWEEMIQKTVCTLAVLLPMKLNTKLAEESELATAILAANKLQVVLHLEQSSKPSRIHPHDFDLYDVQQKLKIKFRETIDAHPKVVDSSKTMPWEVQSCQN